MIAVFNKRYPHAAVYSTQTGEIVLTVPFAPCKEDGVTRSILIAV